MDIREVLMTAGRCAVCDFIGELPVSQEIRNLTANIIDEKVERVIIYNTRSDDYERFGKEYSDFLKRLQLSNKKELKPLYTLI